MMNRQLTIPPQLDKFKAQLKEHFGVRFAGITLYGSYAHNQARPDSDLDLLLILKSSSAKSDDYLSILPLISEFLLETGILISMLIKTKQDLLTQREGVLKNIQSEGICL
jgi:predicted nucleotidyltransferase